MENAYILLNHLSFILTDNCNFNCQYCVLEKSPETISHQTIRQAIDFLHPHLSPAPTISFYGGEPLLAFDKIQFTIQHMSQLPHAASPHYTLTTNGSLITETILDFFNRHAFTIQLSFDGHAQNRTRNPESENFIRSLPARFKHYPHIRFCTLSIFSPHTAPDFRTILQSVKESGSPLIDFNFAITEPWSAKDLAILRRESEQFAVEAAEQYAQKGYTPFKGLAPADEALVKPDVIPSCDGGRTRLAISPSGHVWGCFVFHGALKNQCLHPDYSRYSFGPLEQFIKNHDSIFPAIAKNYRLLRQDNFYTNHVPPRHCFLCDHLRRCFFCPASSAYATGPIGSLPHWACDIAHIKNNIKTIFHRHLQELDVITRNNPTSSDSNRETAQRFDPLHKSDINQ